MSLASTERAVRAFIAVLAVFAAGCPAQDSHAPPRAGSDAALEVAVRDASQSDASTGDASASSRPWPDAIRAERWQEAEDAISSLPSAEQARGEVRYARARIALVLGKHAAAVHLLDGLEIDLPLLREPIEKARATAMMHVGPFDKPAAWFAGRPTVSSWILSAEAWEKANDSNRARAECDRVVAAEARTRAQEEAARAMRMRMARAKDADAAVDARWLATRGFDESIVTVATEILDKIGKPLTAEELVTRAKVLADAGRSEEAMRAVARAGNGSTKGRVTPLELCRARAEAYYKARTRYPEAALAYRACAALGGPHAAEDLFLSARAFSRADRDADALPAFAAVIQRHPKTIWADQAQFHIARSHVLAARWREAASALDDYVKQWPAGKERREAVRYRAIAHLMAHDDKVARKLLEDLAGGADEAIAQARWTNLAALAALRDGDRLFAIGRWSDVARSRPLSWPALVARARLSAAGAPLPLAIEPTEPGEPPTPLDIDLPAPVGMLHRIGFDGDAEQALREREASITAKAAGRTTEALCRAYGELDRAKRRYQVSLQVPARLLASAPGPHNQWAWDCAFPRPYKASIHTQEATARLPPELLWAVMRVESAFDPEVVSPARAVGLLQLMPDTARVVAAAAKLPHEEAWLSHPGHNVALGAFYLRELLDKLHGNVALAAGAYNAGPEAIARWQARAKDEPLEVFVETIPFLETRGYVVRVMGNLARYGYMARGEAGVPEVALELK